MHTIETLSEFDIRVKANQRKLAEDLKAEYDFVICGAGTSGSVLAARLCENPKLRILLLEAGGSDESDLIADPNNWVGTLGSSFDWGYVAEPNPRLNGRAIAYSMGKVLGGGSSINVCTWSRGHKSDWESFALETDDPAWGYESALSLYRTRIEDWAGGPDVLRGKAGKVHVQPAPNVHPFAEALLEGAESVGLPRFSNQNGELMEAGGGCSIVDETVEGGKRRSIFRSYTYPAMAQDNLTVLTEATVRRILFDGNRAAGVEFFWNGAARAVRASLEVVLAQGAIETPKLLMQSGIGDPEELTRFGIQIKEPLTGVGKNLHDHVSFSCIWEATEQPLPMTPRSQAVCFWRTDASLPAPNFYTYAIGVPFPTPENAAWTPPPERGFSLIVGMSPASRGSVRLTGPNPSDPVTINANYLADPQDLKDLVTGIACAREIGNAGPLKLFAKREVHPGWIHGQELQQYLQNGLTTFWHQSCTARMGHDAGSVVNGNLSVHGVEKLRVADASVLPHVTRGNTMAACVVIGERAADILHEEYR